MLRFSQLANARGNPVAPVLRASVVHLSHLCIMFFCLELVLELSVLFLGALGLHVFFG